MPEELSIGALVKRTGVSARMLRHYDEIGLFRPARIGSGGYRWYHSGQIPRLQRILALRRAGMSLPEITRVVAADGDEEAALLGQLTSLAAEHERLGELIATTRRQLDQLRAARITDPEQFPDRHRRDRAAFADRLDSQFRPGAGDPVRQIDPGHTTTADLEHQAAQNADLLARCVELLTDGIGPADARARRLMVEHHAMVTAMWPCSLEQYRALGRLQETDPLQRSIAAAVHPDLPAWLAGAIEAFADTHRAAGAQRPPGPRRRR